MHFTQTTEQSMAINNSPGPAIIISASGMADAGRIKHHLRHNIWREGASIVFVGFQAQGTTGRKIVDGAKKIRLFNEEIAVKARVYTINGFSAHAGQSQLLEWLSHFQTRDMQIFLVHGEYSAQQVLAAKIKEQFGFKVLIPEYLEETTLKPGKVLARVEYPEKAVPRIDWNYIMEDIGLRFDRLKERRPSLESKPWVEQTELRDRLLELNRILTEINSEI
jgi:metallo-beta-lactamase family protein